MLIDHASTNEYNENFEEVPIVFFLSDIPHHEDNAYKG